MKEVSRKVFDQKARDGEWQVDAEPNSHGMAWVRNARGKQFPVRVH